MFESMNQNQIPFEPAEWFPELDALQKSGSINMFGAPNWLQENLGFTKETFTSKQVTNLLQERLQLHKLYKTE